MAARLDGFTDKIAPEIRAAAEIDLPSAGHEIIARMGPCDGFDLSVTGRMVSSCLVDADFRDTEAFSDPLEGRRHDRDWPALGLLLPELRAVFDRYMGLDPAVGFLHRDRPGRPSLALDLMEELRAPLADRLALSLVNRRQLRAGDFRAIEGGAVLFSDEGRKDVPASWLDEAADSMIASFARGLRGDCAAVTAALRERWSNGRTERQINRLKTLKRQMYGRADCSRHDQVGHAEMHPDQTR